jgi:hypothetical protein
MAPWEIHSNSRQQTLLSVVCLAVGLVLVGLLHDYDTAGSSRHAGFLFGVVLLAIGGATLAANARQTIVVDPLQKEIRVLDQRLFGRRQRAIAFSDIGDVQVACLQTRAQNVIRYCLQLQLHNDEAYTLFAPARVYEGASDPAIVAGWKTRLDSYLAADATGAQTGPTTR